MRLFIVLLVGLSILFALGCSHKVVVIKTNTSEKKLDSRAIPKEKSSKDKQSDIFLAKAIKFYNKGKYKQALKFCEKAINFNHKNWEAHYYMGLASQRNRAYAQSIEALKLGLKLGPKNKFVESEIHCNIGINYEKMGMTERARSEYLLSLNLNESNQDARKGLNRLKVNKTMKNWRKNKKH
ncbi:MAG: hypothetical protein GY865_04080 [candidate division Zixibacteria bacterium]|nr:hypothetical protein [candidate division Zixibacteria bacterium]